MKHLSKFMKALCNCSS